MFERRTEPVEADRRVETRGVAGPLDTRRHRKDDGVVRRQEAELRRAIAEKIGEVPDLVRFRCQRHVACDEPLLAGQIGGHQPHDMAARTSRIIVKIFDV